jgi:hypothetical protein
MKKCKRILSLALASAMVMGMFAMSASAEDGNNNSATVDKNGMSLTALTSVPTSKTVKVNRNTVIPDDTEFTLVMEPAGDAADAGKDFKDADGKTVEISGQKVKNGIPFETTKKTVQNDEGQDEEEEVSTGIVTYTFGADTDTSGGEGNTNTQVDVTLSNQSFDLTKIPFTSTGIYRYYVTETAGTESYITYDSAKYEVDVYVIEYTTTETVKDESSEDPDATKDVTTKSYGVGAVTLRKMTKSDTGYSYEDEKPTTCGFTNEIKVNNVKIQKQIEGTPKTTGEAFTFYIRIPAGGDALNLTAGTEIKAVKHTENGGTEDVILTVKADAGLEKTTAADGTVTDPVLSLTTADLKDSTKFDSFTLKDQEYLELVGMPQGMIYYLAEADVTDEGYSQYWTYSEQGSLATDTSKQNTSTALPKHDAIKTTTTDDGTVTSSVIFQGTVNTISNDVTFINSRIITANTGINIDLIPYVLVMLIAVCGAVLFISKKRRIAR